jgi:hypothetical protein
MSARILASGPFPGLLAGVALILALAFSSPAHAFACESTFSIDTSTTSQTDCAGRDVAVDFTDLGGNSGSIVLSGAGPWDQNDWFSDLHFSIQIDTGEGLPFWDSGADSFFTNDAGDSWAESFPARIYPDPSIGSFVAHDNSERVYPGDDYSWQVKLSYYSVFNTNASVTIGYTMDVPEPALAVVLLGGLAAVALARRRGA